MLSFLFSFWSVSVFLSIALDNNPEYANVLFALEFLKSVKARTADTTCYHQQPIKKQKLVVKIFEALSGFSLFYTKLFGKSIMN